MGVRGGTANLPLHHGRVPPWLAERMSALGSALVEATVLVEGRDGFLKRLSDPFWFQSFGAVLGMDWHSSGITTSVMGALKRGLAPKSLELGIHVFGGRGKHSLKTPEELRRFAEKTGLDGEALVRTSKLTAKVDNTAIQDGYALYLHSFVVTNDGRWVVVQQGMNDKTGWARRYHWRSDSVSSFVEEPHEAVVGKNEGVIINLTDKRSAQAREATVQLVGEGPEKTIEAFSSAVSRCLNLPARHEIRPSDVFIRRLHGVLKTAEAAGTKDFESLLLTEGLGPRTLQALALTAEVTMGAPSRFDDPARYAFAHGGKDGHPFPVPLRVYDETISTLRDALHRAKLGDSEKMEAFLRLDKKTRELERFAKGPSFDEIVEKEWRSSAARGGMTAMGPVSKAVERRVRGRTVHSNEKQLKLFG